MVDCDIFDCLLLGLSKRRSIGWSVDFNIFFITMSVDDIPGSGREAGSVKTASQVQLLFVAKNISRAACETNDTLLAGIDSVGPGAWTGFYYKS